MHTVHFYRELSVLCENAAFVGWLSFNLEQVPLAGRGDGHLPALTSASLGVCSRRYSAE